MWALHLYLNMIFRVIILLKYQFCIYFVSLDFGLLGIQLYTDHQ